MSLYLRNLRTGEIKTVEADSAEFAKLRLERAEDGRPLFEQTGPHDADPKNHAAEYEVTHRGEYGVPLPDVTTDGVGQSAKSAEKLGNDAPVGPSASGRK